MASRSASVARRRPFYARHASAYDALITDPVEPWVEAVHDTLAAAGKAQARLLDAGCGTGRHARGLLDLGHRVSVLDASPDLLHIARRRCPEAAFHCGDICARDLCGDFDAVICRGVLNDLVADRERDAAMDTFARLLGPRGLVLLDVREAGGSARRADGTTRHHDAALEGGERLRFATRSRWDAGLLRVSERYELYAADGTRTSTEDYAFVMRPWSVEELHTRLATAGLTAEIRPAGWRTTGDRLFVVARRE